MNELTPNLVSLQGSDGLPVLRAHLFPLRFAGEAERLSPKGRLFTATLHLRWDHVAIHVFHACHALTKDQALEGLAARIPTAHLATVRLREGIDRSDAVVLRLVPDAIADSLADHGDCCPSRRPLAAGGIIQIIEHAQGERPDEVAWQAP